MESFSKHSQETPTGENSSLLHSFVDDRLPLDSTAKTIVEEAVKQAPLFITGKVGLGLTLTTHALAEIKAKDTTNKQIVEGLSGAGKGLLTRAAFDAFGRLSPVLELLPTKYNLALKGAGLGVVSRFSETAGSLDTWLNKDGKVDCAQGLKLTGATVFSPVALTCDVASFGLAKGMHVGLNAATKGLVDRNAMLAMSVMGSTFGMNSGAVGEYVRQLKDNEKLDWQKIGHGAFIGGAAGGLSSLPGGYQLHLKANQKLKSMDFQDEQLTIKDHAVQPVMSAEKHPRLQLASSVPILRYAEIAEPSNSFNLELQEPRHYAYDRKLYKRLTEKPSTKEDLQVWDSTNKSIRSETVSFTNYSVDGHQTQISLPSDYADKLYSVRAGRIEEYSLRKAGDKTRGSKLFEKVVSNLSHIKDFQPEHYKSYKNRLLPEFVVRRLDELPNSNLIRRVILLEDNLASDHLDLSITRADASKDPREMRTFALDQGPDFARTMRHEWSHFLQYEYPQKYNYFCKALGIEKGLSKEGKNPRPYGATKVCENFAVIGETLLEPSAKTFIQWLNLAPNRSSIFSLALGDSLVDNPAETSINRIPLTNRVDFVKTEAIPRLQEQLLKELREIDAERDPTGTGDRLGVLAEISGNDFPNQIKDLLKNTKSPTMIKEIVQAGLERLIEHPEKQVDFLLALPKNACMNEAVADAVIDLSAETFTNHYFPKLKELETRSGKDNWRFLNAYAMFDLRCWNDCRSNNSLPPEPMLYWLDRAKPTELHYFHEVALSKLEAKASKALKEQQITTALSLYEKILPLKQKLGQTADLGNILAKIEDLRKSIGQ